MFCCRNTECSLDYRAARAGIITMGKLTATQREKYSRDLVFLGMEPQTIGELASSPTELSSPAPSEIFQTTKTGFVLDFKTIRKWIWSPTLIVIA